MSNPPQLLPPSPERRSLWKPIGIAILGSFLVGFGSCAGGILLSAGPVRFLSQVFIMLGMLSFFLFLVSLAVAFFYFLAEVFRKGRGK